jgi:hypothetical protein
MIVVVVVAFNLWAVRRIKNFDGVRLNVVVSSGLLLQLGIFRLVRCEFRASALWVGFVAANGLAFASLMITGIRYWEPLYQYSSLVDLSTRYPDAREWWGVARWGYPGFRLVIAVVDLLALAVFWVFSCLLVRSLASFVENADGPVR